MRDRLPRVRTLRSRPMLALGVAILLMATASVALSARPTTLLDAKLAQRQAIDADTQAARSGTRAAADPNFVSPVRTPPPYATGIIVDNGNGAPAPSEDFVTRGVWRGLVNSEVATVYSGGSATDPNQGMLIVVRTSADFLRTRPLERYRTATASGLLRIVAAEGARVSLTSEGGEPFTFEVATGQLVSGRATALAMTGSVTSEFHDSTAVAARLTELGTTIPVNAKPLTFRLGDASCVASTGLDGLASCDLTPLSAAGTYPLTVSFAGDAGYLAGTRAANFTVTLEESALTLPDSMLVRLGARTELSATLKEDGLAPIAGRVITLALGGQTCSGTSGPDGVARCELTSTQPLGPVAVTAAFSSDGYYHAAGVAGTAFVYDYPAVGAFAVGDLSRTGSVAFWGAAWNGVNSLSGGTAPLDFKGFENSVSLPTCGASWTTDPGNSSNPPPAIPSYMALVVTTRVTQVGSTLSGDVVAVIVVQTNTGYAPNVGHAGTGTVVGSLCQR